MLLIFVSMFANEPYPYLRYYFCNYKYADLIENITRFLSCALGTFHCIIRGFHRFCLFTARH